MTNEEILSNAKVLSKPLQEVLELYYQDRLTQKDIAERLNISVYKVRLILSKAMYLLKKGAGDEEYGKARKILYDNLSRPKGHPLRRGMDLPS